MRRKPYLWAVPVLLLFTALWGLKWKRDHPRPTKEDLAVRRSLSRARTLIVNINPQKTLKPSQHYKLVLPPQELQALVDHFYLLERVRYSNYLNTQSQIDVGWINSKKDRNVTGGWIILYPQKGVGRYLDFTDSVTSTEYYLRPSTIRYILALLQNDPKIGPKVMKVLGG